MYRPASVVLSLGLLVLALNPVIGQSSRQQATAPMESARNAEWYVNGDPVVFAGNLYYRTGPQVYFNPYEMVRSGFYGGVPLYTRTTIEPYSMVFVPLGGGLMQPYERRRAGDIAGTVGSTAPSFPVVTSGEAGTGSRTLGEPPEAPAPPTLAPAVDLGPKPVGDSAPLPPPEPVATGGSPATYVPTYPMRTALRPRGLNGVFIEHDGARWFNAGRPVLIGRDNFAHVGTYRDLPVYQRRSDARTIYIPVQRGSELLTPFERRRR